MALFDIFKKSKKTETKKTPKKATLKAARAKAESEIMKQSLDEALKPKESSTVEQKAELRTSKSSFVEASAGKRVERKQFSEAYRILKSPHVTEKSGLLAGQNSYVFKVGPSANKHEIKQAVQNLYGVSVEKVAVINIPKKARRVGKSQGFKAGFRKAMVKLARGEKIEIMPR